MHRDENSQRKSTGRNSSVLHKLNIVSANNQHKVGQWTKTKFDQRWNVVDIETLQKLTRFGIFAD